MQLADVAENDIPLLQRIGGVPDIIGAKALITQQ